jgi:heme-degrading monooxygenase HmoA
MICSVFAYTVDPARRDAFERVYGPDGEWARYFRRAPGYLGTELLHNGDEYLLIDRWESEAAYDAFLTANADEYARRNREASPLYRAERVIGRFSPVR